MPIEVIPFITDRTRPVVKKDKIKGEALQPVYDNMDVAAEALSIALQQKKLLGVVAVRTSDVGVSEQQGYLLIVESSEPDEAANIRLA